ncbi:diamine acetyltransferase 2-like isoform X1 [Hyposmocoma kahamanoa]|uniref:diamine acetyltransferase 2-like isoform X1 n=1 Tax=Hyposmocoma kahamanoa TaxID=1477025 RepID=UPI000E6D6E74|nr:diamine acetyltransferase 2-like isoform X1 [Hyposmocoma kahamanoa]
MHANTLPNPTEKGASGGATRGTEVHIRLATRDDMPEVLKMIQELADYEGVPTRLHVHDLVRDGFESSPPWFFVLLAVRDEQLLGQALCNYAYSSWTGRSFYLEDLYVYPHVRRLGVARRLLQHLCEMAVKKGVSRIDWHVLKNNAPALALYARTGARDMCLTEGRVALRLDAPRIQAVAQGHLLPPAPAQV